MSSKTNKQGRNNRKPYSGKPSRDSRSNRGRQGRKDNDTPRENFDNVRSDKMADIIARAMTNKGHNDFGWYSRNPELLTAAASLPFAEILGSQGPAQNAVPGILEINWRPAFGPGGKPIAINQASDAVYSNIVHANSREYSATAPDYMIMAIAGMQVFCIIQAAIRAFRSIRLYREENLYYPAQLLSSMGCDFQDWMNNLSTIWFDLNALIQQTEQIWIPNVFPLMERWSWLNSNVFVDAVGDRAQTYVFTQNQYLMYSETGSTTGSSLIRTPVNGLGTLHFEPSSQQHYTWSEWKGTIQAMIDALISAEDRGIIYGNILRAYGRENLYGLAPINPDEILTPVWNAEVLSQIENVIVVDPKFTPMGLVQIGEDLYPVYPAKVAGDKIQHYPLHTVVVNTHVPTQPTTELIVEATRFTALGLSVGKIVGRDASSGEGDTWTPKVGQGYILESMGTEVATGFGIHSIVNGEPRVDRNGSHPTTATDLDFITRLIPFDWHPFQYFTANASQPWTVPASAPSIGTQIIPAPLYYATGDYDNYIWVGHHEMTKIHTACVFSLWGVPQMVGQRGKKDRD